MSTGCSFTSTCCDSLDGSLFRRLRRVSTVLATVAVKNASCFGSSSDSVTRDSSVPVFGSIHQPLRIEPTFERVIDLERGD